MQSALYSMYDNPLFWFHIGWTSWRPLSNELCGYSLKNFYVPILLRLFEVGAYCWCPKSHLSSTYGVNEVLVAPHLRRSRRTW
ncbi:hypothetical protein L6452_43528 [Arctium lappa]|uniref:Uncharacterized protein n=1 Tax=Arctium lappa TaxID=4217 RepID=A0ACB8XEB2_ARCLA|nr:hypothetical protein L6452_43528 [Arctium lappa]